MFPSHDTRTTQLVKNTHTHTHLTPHTSPSFTPTETPTPTITPSNTPTQTLTPSITPSPTETPTNTPSITLARNFKVSLPWLMWHKSPNCCSGQTFYVDPAGFDGLDLFQLQYIKSLKNPDMNYPGIRYYNLWDTNPNDDGYPSRVGKVFPDIS